MANSKVVFHDAEIKFWLNSEPAIRSLLMTVGQAVATQAQATASSAEEGSGGRIDGYASAGFRVEWVTKGRPQVRIMSNAPSDMITAAHFHTQIRDGVAHLRAALYKFTTRG